MPDITWDDEAPGGGVKWDTAPAPSSVTWDDEKPPANPVFAQHRAAKAKQEAEWAAVAEAAAPKPPTEDPVPSGILGSYENAYRSLIRPITGAVSDFAHKKFDEAFGAARQYAADPRVPAPVQAVAGATAGVGGLAEGMTTIDPVEIAKSVYELPQGVAESARQTGEAIGQGHVGQAVESGIGTLGMIGMGALIGKETLGRGMNQAVHVEGRDAMPPKFRRNPETGGLERYMGPEAWSRGEGWKPVDGPMADQPQSPEQVQARYEQVAAQPTFDEVRANMRGGAAIQERLQAPPPEPSPIIAGRPPADITWDDALEGRKAAVRTAEQDIQLRDIERRAAERGYDASRETAAADAYARATGQEAPPPEPEPVAAAAGVPEQAPPVPDRSPNDRVRAIAREYNAGRGMPAPEEGVNLKAVEERARQVADAYESLKDQNLEDPAVKQAYEALANEVDAQWDAATRAGFKFEPWEREGQPYANSAEMMRDVRDNGHLYFFRGGEPHPFMSRIDPQTGLTSNDKFRAIHDLFGHAAEGYQFGPHGEESAWYRHSQMFSPEAQRAMSTETRGQNSWVNYGKQNYGPNGERLNIPMTERPYAKQKVDLLPVEMTDWKSARGESLPEPLAREVTAAKARLEKLRQAGADQTGSILHKNTGEELDTTSDHVRTLAAAILWRADGRELSLKAFDRQMRKEFGKNVYRVTERGGQYDLTPEQAMHGGVVKLAELTVRAAERGDTGKITPHKDIKRRTDAGVAMGATEWYERGMKELAAELGLDVTKRISRFETGYSPRKRVQFSILRAVDATIREAEGKLPRTNNFDHKTVMSAYVNDPVTGQKLTPYDASKAAALGGPEPRTTVVDTIMSKSAGFDEVVNESVQRFVDAVNRMETNRIGADKIQKAQAATWSGYQQEIGNEGATRSWAELVRDAIEKSGGIEAFKERVKEYYSDDTSFDTAAMDAKPTPQEIVLRHRSPKADLTELDPEFMGTNRPGTESRRADRPKAVYLNKEGVPFEPGLGTNEFEARTHIGPGGLYDDATDPLKLKERPRNMDLDRATQYQRDVIAAGYKGHIAEDGRVAYFDKLPVKRILGDQTGSILKKSAPGEPRENFDDTAALMGFAGRSGLRQLEKADPELAAKFRKVPTIYHAGRDMVAGLSKQLLANGLKFKQFATIMTEHRLIGAEERLRALAADVKKMSPSDALDNYASGTADSMLEVVNALHQTPKGKVLKIKDGAEAAFAAGDGDALKAHLEKAFTDAADDVTHLMPRADFDAAVANPKFKTVLDYYKNNIEPILDAAHQSNQGKRSPHLGPLDTFYPLSGVEKDTRQARIRKRLLNMPQNPWNKFTTGLANEYDLTPESLQKNIGTAMRANAMADALDAGVNAGLMRQMKGTSASATFRYRGEDYHAAGDGRWVMPKWFKDEIEPILDGAHASWPNAKLQAVRDKLNWVALVGPFDFAYHGLNVLGTSHKIPATAFTSPMAKAVANLPIVGKMPAILVDMFRESTKSPTFQSDVARLRDMGLLHDSYASETLFKKLSEESGIPYVGGDSKSALVRGAKKTGGAMGTALYGPGGIDIRARVAFLRAADKMGLTPTETYHFVNNLGNYVYQLNGDLARGVKKAGLSPFYTAGSTMGWNGMVQLLGTQHLPAKNSVARNSGIRLYQAINSGAIGALLVWAAHYKAQTDKFPWEDPEHAKLFKVPTGENPDGSTEYTSIVDLFAPGLSRGARLLGVRGAAETLARGGTKGQAADAAATDSINTMIHPLAGPLPSMALRFGGWDPSLSSIYDDRYGKPRIQLRSRIGKAEPGLPELGERLKYAAGGTNPLIEKGSGLLDDDSGDKPKMPTSLEEAADLVMKAIPRLKTKGNPRKEAQRIRRAQR